MAGPKIIKDFPLLAGVTSSLLIAVGDPNTGVLYKSTIGFISSGPQGTLGPTGIQGVVGLQGIQGEPGIGYTGSLGLQGSRGALGFQGLPGLTGVQGIQGRQGVQGRQGFVGLQGLQGFQGTQGVNGSQGLQGPQGLIGIQGLTGFQGFQGNQGHQGFSFGFTGPNNHVLFYSSTGGGTVTTISGFKFVGNGDGDSNTLSIPGSTNGTSGTSTLNLNGNRVQLISATNSGLVIKVGNGGSGLTMDASKGFRIDNNGVNYVNMASVAASGTSGYIARINIVYNANLLCSVLPMESNYWGTSGIGFRVDSNIYKDITSATGSTAGELVTTSFGIPTFRTENSGITYSDLSTVYIAGPPISGTGCSYSGGSYSLKVATGKTWLGGSLNIQGVFEYTDNSNAIVGGLTMGDFYRTGDNLKIVH